jgi:deoxyribose-phosphate aldolase
VSFPLAQAADLARRIDHTLLRADATRGEIERLCAEARRHGFRAVCVNGCRVELAAHFLEESEVKVCCAIGQPLGAMDGDVKRYEVEVAVDHGAQELEVALNLGWLKDGEHLRLLRELRDVVEAAEERPVGASFPSGLLSVEPVAVACALAQEAGVRWVCLCAGLAGGEASLTDVQAIRAAVGAKFDVKVSGPVTSLAKAQGFIGAGATRFGTGDGPSLLKTK